MLKMVMKRDWTGKDSKVNYQLLVKTMEGMSPFNMLNMNEDVMVTMNHEDDLVTS